MRRCMLHRMNKNNARGKGFNSQTPPYKPSDPLAYGPFAKVKLKQDEVLTECALERSYSAALQLFTK